MSKRKFGIDSDLSKLVSSISSMTEAQIAELQRIQNGNSCLAPILETIRQAYEAAAPRPKIPVRN
jgi:hypothetical protein